MKFNEIAFTILPVSDLKRSRAFFEQTLGLKPANVWEHDGKGMIEYDIGVGTLAIGSGVDLFKPPANGGGAIALEAAEFDQTIAGLKQKAVPFALEPMDTPVCRMAVIKDPDANLLIIHKRKAG